jgi:hypothetical protein
MKTVSTLFLMLVIAFNLQAQDATPLSESKFETLRDEVAVQSYDSKRLSKAKELSDAHYLYVNQIKAIIETLSLSGSKMEYAKYAYTTVLDAENYDKLYALFRRDSEVEELKAYVSKRKPPVIAKKEVEKEVVKDNTSTNSTVSNTNSTTSSVTTTKTTVKKSSGPIPMTDQEFAIAKREVEGEPYESKKLRRAKQVSDANYMLCNQVVELMGVLSFESSRMEYAEYAYAKTYNQGDYEVVKEGLSHSKDKEALGAFLKKQTVADYSVIEVVEENTATNNTDGGSTVGGMSDDDFTHVKTEVLKQSSDSKKLEKAKQFISRTYLSSVQVKEVVDLFLFEENRLDFAKFAFSKVSDKDNYGLVKEALEKDSHVKLEEYINAAPKGDEVTVTTEPSELSSEDFAALLKKIKAQSLESHKLDKARIVVDRAHVNTSQIKQIMDLFDKEESRLEFAKYAYPRTLDKENYKVVRETLYKSTNKYTLDRYIKDHK